MEIDQLWDYSDPRSSEARFRDALESAESPAQRGVLRTQVARALGLQRRFDEGHAELDALSAQLLDEDAELRVRAVLERGRLHNSSGDRERASVLFREALAHAQRAGLDALAVDSAHMLGISEPGEAGAGWTHRAIEIAETSDDPMARRWRASLLNNLGWSEFEAGRYEVALDCFERALEARIEGGDQEQIRIARWCVGRALRALGRAEEARTIQWRLLDEYDAAGSPSGYVYEELGECALAEGDADAAGPYFERAYALLSQDSWLVERESERLARLKRLGVGGGGID